MSKRKATTTMEPKEEARVPKSKTIEVDITLPLAEHGRVILTRIECKLTSRQGTALRYLFDGLVAEGQKIQLAGQSRDPVRLQPDALRWLLDRIADGVSLPGGATPEAPG